MNISTTYLKSLILNRCVASYRDVYRQKQKMFLKFDLNLFIILVPIRHILVNVRRVCSKYKYVTLLFHYETMVKTL